MAINKIINWIRFKGIRIDKHSFGAIAEVTKESEEHLDRLLVPSTSLPRNKSTLLSNNSSNYRNRSNSNQRRTHNTLIVARHLWETVIQKTDLRRAREVWRYHSSPTEECSNNSNRNSRTISTRSKSRMTRIFLRIIGRMCCQSCRTDVSITTRYSSKTPTISTCNSSRKLSVYSKQHKIRMLVIIILL